MPGPEPCNPEPVDLRKVWPNEAWDFTPWLAENLHLLGKAVGMELSLIQTEASGWSGSLDILAETSDRVNVAIENQLEPSDSDHFARLIGYAANHDASILIWVAPHFYNYHLRMLGWLKAAIADSREIYAVEVRLELGGELSPADGDAKPLGFKPVFKAVELHNNWPKSPVLTLEEQAKLPQERQAFFNRLLGDLRRKGFTDRQAPRAGRCQSFPSGFPGITYNAGFEWNRPFVYLWISVGDRAESARIYEALSQYQGELQSELQDLQFDVIGQHGGWRWVSLGMSRDGHIGDPNEKLDEIKSWMSSNIVRLKEVIDPRLQKVMEQSQSVESFETEPKPPAPEL